MPSVTVDKIHGVGTLFFAVIDGDWADDPDALAAALRSDWPEMKVRPDLRSDYAAYRLEFDGYLGSLHADGQGFSFKHGDELVIRLAAWWRPRVPATVRLTVFNDSTAIDVDVPPGVTPAELQDLVAAAEAG
jgi:hypothetical protein